MRKIRTMCASAAVLALSLGAASPALAVTWATQERPVYGYEHGKAFGKMSGKFYNDRSVRAMSTTWQYDRQADHHNVRVETDFYFYEYDDTCSVSSTGIGSGMCWRFDVSKQTKESGYGDGWVKRARARGLHADGDRARGAINICEIIRWHNDPCSRHAYPTFSY